MGDDSQFHKEEYLALRSEIELILREFTQIRIYCVVGVAGVFSWAAAQTYPSFVAAWLAWMIAAVIPICGAIAVYARSKHIDRIGDYIRKIEDDFIPQGKVAQGWEHFHDANSRRELTKADAVFWWTLIALTLVIGIVGGLNGRLAIPCGGEQAQRVHRGDGAVEVIAEVGDRAVLERTGVLARGVAQVPLRPS